jgi:hypothetical protein
MGVQRVMLASVYAGCSFGLALIERRQVGS